MRSPEAGRSPGPVFPQGLLVSRLADMHKSRCNLAFERPADVHRRVWRVASEQPHLVHPVRCQGRQPRLTFQCQPRTGQWRDRIERGTPHSSVVRVTQVRRVRTFGIESEDHFGLPLTDSRHELHAQISIVLHFTVGQPQEGHVLDAEAAGGFERLCFAYCL